MIPITTFAQMSVALFGLGGSGLATARALVVGGAKVSVWDDHAAARAGAEQAGLSVVDLSQADWSGFECFVLSPGVPLTHPEPHWTVKLAQAAGVEVIGDIELFCRERANVSPDCPFVAITGTNGKSTTTALIAHILREAGKDVQMGGNIGVPILALGAPRMDRYYVIECSSFQIDLAPSLAPSVGVLLNLTPDHIERHGSMENYAAVKERLVASSDEAVIGVDDAYCVGIIDNLLREEMPTFLISKQRSEVLGCVYYENQRLQRRVASPGDRSEVKLLADLAPARALRGAHNGQNAAAAFSVCECLKIPRDQIVSGLTSYPGLPHRMEEVGRLGRVLLVNDSKATNADATEKALLSFNDIFWIIGGKSKEGGIEPLRPLFNKIRKAYLIGAASDDFAGALGNDVMFEHCGTLDVAIESAARDAATCEAKEPVVLLSPACASYDQFPNFEVRGNKFRDLARALTARAVTN